MASPRVVIVGAGIVGTALVDGLVPELQRRGLTRSHYTYEQFTDNLLEF